MVILHAFLALLAGFAAIALVVTLVTALLARLTPEWVRPPSPGEGATARSGYLAVNLGYSFLAASAGGYGTAWAAAANPLVHVLALAIVMLVLAALSAMQSKGTQPLWHALLLVALTPIGVLVGGLLRLRVLGIL